jgi:hypothetical protein
LAKRLFFFPWSNRCDRKNCSVTTATPAAEDSAREFPAAVPGDNRSWRLGLCPSFASAHCSTSRCPPIAAFAHVNSSHGHPFSRATTVAPQGARPPPHSYMSCGPTGIRSRATTASSRGVRPSPRTYTSTRPTGIRYRAPIAAPRGVRRSPPSSTYTCSTGSRSRAPIEAPRGARPPPPPSTSYRFTDIRLRAPTAAPRGARPLPHPCT